MGEKLDERAMILRALELWIKQRAGLEFGNYGDLSSYRSEQRRITRQLHDARRLLAAVSWRSSIGAEELRAAFKGAYSGRLSIVDRDDGSIGLEYCTGQYFPTEYRAAACAVLSAALWGYTRANMPKGTADPASPFGALLYNGQTAGDWIRGNLRKEFGAHMQRRWFD